MNRLLLVAAVLAALTACIHVVVGTAEIASPLLRSSLAPEVRYLLYACWHLVSCVLVFSAVGLFVSAWSRQQHARLLVLYISWLWLAFGVVFILVGLLGAHGALFFKLPQWALLLPVGVLGLLGGARSRSLPSDTVSLAHGHRAP